jgi:mono/diheme cytochrome c family protein
VTRLPLLAAIAASALLMTGCKGGAQTPAGADQHPGQLLFNGHTKPDVDCYKCHDGTGRGAGQGPDLSERVPKLTDEQIKGAIMDGPGMMPSFKDKLSDEEANRIVAWLRAQFPAPGGAPAAAPAPAPAK